MTMKGYLEILKLVGGMRAPTVNVEHHYCRSVDFRALEAFRRRSWDWQYGISILKIDMNNEYID